MFPKSMLFLVLRYSQLKCIHFGTNIDLRSQNFYILLHFVKTYKNVDKFCGHPHHPPFWFLECKIYQKIKYLNGLCVHKKIYGNSKFVYTRIKWKRWSNGTRLQKSKRAKKTKICAVAFVDSVGSGPEIQSTIETGK